MMKKIIFSIFVIILGVLFSPSQILAQNYKLELSFFYSETCSHCVAEQKFLDGLEIKYPEIKINRYLITDQVSQQLLKDLLKKHDAERYFGAVPMNFVGEDFIPGFDSAEDIGKQIEESIQKQLNNINPNPKNGNKIKIPIIGEVDMSKYSLPALTIVLGILDGFNVCSLGAIVLILGLVLALRSRKKILIFGGIFLITTALVYGILIILWHQLFSIFAKYQKIMEILIGLLGIGGGVYFIKEFLRFRKHGPTCDTKDKKITTNLFSKIKNIFQRQGQRKILPIVAGILLFAALITIVEFPCSAAVPVIYAGILANAKLPGMLYILYIALYLILYLLDEVLVFLIALFTLKLWLASKKFVTWITLAEAIILFLLGLYYLL